jgi:hypothetical protein
MEGRAIPDPAFDPAHVAAADPGNIRKLFLGESSLPPQVADACAESLEGGMLGRLTSLAGHVPDAGASRPFRPRPMGYNGSGRCRNRVEIP